MGLSRCSESLVPLALVVAMAVSLSLARGAAQTLYPGSLTGFAPSRSPASTRADASIYSALRIGTGRSPVTADWFHQRPQRSVFGTRSSRRVKATATTASPGRPSFSRAVDWFDGARSRATIRLRPYALAPPA